MKSYGEKKLYEGGLSVRTTLDPKLQVVARKALADGLVKFDEAQGWRGAVQQDRHRRRLGREARRGQGAGRRVAWRLAVVLETSDQSARIGLQPPREPRRRARQGAQIGNIPLDGVKWAKAAEGPTRGRVPTKVNQVLNVGDVIYVEPLDKEANTGGCGRCRKSPAPSW